MHQIGSLICNEHDKLMVKMTILFLLCSDAGVACIMQEVDLMVEVGEKEPEIWSGLQGVNHGVNKHVEDHNLFLSLS